MSLWLTGDCHGEFTRFSTRRFPQQKEMSKERDVVLILGDAGFQFEGGSKREEHWLDWLEGKPWVTVNIGGNHENYQCLKEYPEVPFHGGTARQIRPSVYELSRGRVFEFCGKKVFAMGGAQSHDMKRVLFPGPELPAQIRAMRRLNVPFRISGLSWWPEEMPGMEEYAAAIRALERVDYKADLIVTHCAPDSIQRRLAPDYPENRLTGFLDGLLHKAEYGRWYCGHYHKSWTDEDSRFQVLFEDIVKIEDEEST